MWLHMQSGLGAKAEETQGVKGDVGLVWYHLQEGWFMISVPPIGIVVNLKTQNCPLLGFVIMGIELPH